MTDPNTTTPFHLSAGGLFYRLMARTRLLDEDRHRVGLRIPLFVCLTWLPLLILSTLDGALADRAITLPFLYDPILYARYLIVLPLLIAADAIIDPLLGPVVQHLETSGVVPEEELPGYREAVAKITRRRDSVWVEIVLFVLALGVSWLFQPGYSDLWLKEGVSSWAWTVTNEGSRVTAAGWWYLIVSAPIMQFLLYRWIWRFGIWVSFLRRIARVRFALLASHSDLAGGLSILGRGQNGFVVLFVALAALMSGEIAKDILYEGYKLAAALPVVIGYSIFSAAALFGPLLLFSSQMLLAKRRALREYGTLQYQLSDDFHRNWVTNKAKDLVDSMQPSAMADYNVVYETVISMRFVPLEPKPTALIALAVLVPFLPLVLTEYSIDKILGRIFHTFI